MSELVQALNRIQELEQQLTSTQQRIAELEAELKTTQLDRHNSQVDAVKNLARAGAAEKQASEVTKMFNKESAAKLDAESRVRELEKERDELRAKLDAVNECMESQRRVLNERARERDELKAENTRLRAVVDAARVWRDWQQNSDREQGIEEFDLKKALRAIDAPQEPAKTDTDDGK